MQEVRESSRIEDFFDAERFEFRVRGMDCAEEIETLRQVLVPLVGSEDRLAFDLLNSKLVVSLPAACSEEMLVDAVAATGMRATPFRKDGGDDDDQHRRKLRTALTVGSGIALVAGFLAQVVLAGGVSEALGGEGSGLHHTIPWAARAAYLLAIAAGLALVAPKAWSSARRLRPDMNLLMTVAVAGALGIGEWFEAAAVSFLFALSLELEAWSLGRARRAISALMELTPPSVLVLLEDGSRAEVPPSEVAVGTRFLVRPGDRIALDGEIAEGESDVNQAPITGESAPVMKEPGSEVFAGTVNGGGALTVVSTKPQEDTTLAHIVRLVSEAHSRRAPSEQWVQKFARVYTPAVMALAASVFILPVLFGAPAAPWLYRALVLLVIACPCALVISTPVSIVAGLAGAARNGILIKGGVYLEAPARLRAIAFDKTGTLTEGKPRVQHVAALGGHTVDEVLENAAAMEAQSAHPLALAIREHASSLGMDSKEAVDFTAIHGKGGTARIGDREYWIGSHRFLEERGQETHEVHEKLEELSSDGQTVVVLGNDEHVCGFLALSDGLRSETPQALKALRAAGISPLVMLTGDNKATGNAVGRHAGVDEVHAELLPEDKVALIEELTKAHEFVAMVGDGVNDAPAMARASIGIAMGAAGSDAAIETADIALMADDLSKLPWLIHHSRRTLSIIRANVVLSLAIKALFVVLTLFGSASLWSAIAADMGASLVVTFNGLRLLRSPKTRQGPTS